MADELEQEDVVERAKADQVAKRNVVPEDQEKKGDQS